MKKYKCKNCGHEFERANFFERELKLWTDPWIIMDPAPIPVPSSDSLFGRHKCPKCGSFKTQSVKS